MLYIHRHLICLALTGLNISVKGSVFSRQWRRSDGVFIVNFEITHDECRAKKQIFEISKLLEENSSITIK